MKTNKYIIIFAAILAAFQACSLEKEPRMSGDVEGLSLTFFTEKDFVVKADPGYEDRAGEDAWNENLLASVEYFLYRDGRTDEDAVLHGYLTNVRRNAPYSVPLTDDIINNTLCSGNAKYFMVYAIANHDRIIPDAGVGGTENLSGTTVPALEALTQDLDDPELTDDDHGEQVVTTNQTKFLMATDGPLRVGPINKRQTTIATARVELKRVAVKLSIVIRVEPQVILPVHTTIGEVTINRDEIWEPRMSETSIYLVNGVHNGQVSGEPVASPDLFEHAPIYFDYSSGETHSYSSFKLRTNDNGDPVDENGDVITEDSETDYIYDETTKSGTFYPTKTAFYSFPVKWFFGSAEEPYLKLMIPWDRVEYNEVNGETVRQLKQSKQYYYRVYCPGSTGDGSTCDAEFLRNHWYKVILNVGILGSETDGGEIIINGTYYVADWQERDTGSQSGGGETPSGVNDSDKEAEIKGAKYLFVNKEEYELYNVDDLLIPYITSDPCEIVDFSATRSVFSGSTKTTETITNKADWGITLNLITNENGAHINFYHALDNNLNGTTYDVSEYDITFRIQQVGDSNYYKDITIRQSPAIKIDLENNNNSNHYGNTYVNNGRNLSWCGNTNGTSSGTNTNFNMVIIETTVLPPDSVFMLGDPRTSYIDNIYYNRTNQTSYNESYETWPNTTDAQRINTNNNWSASATAIEGGTRRLSYYYPVNRSDEANNIIAPRFRVASSHGATNAVNYANAFRRCAAYQENGYPAGRWRLPTVAEVTYAMKLNADGKIQRLFGTTNNGETSDYWCNCGYITVYDGTNAASKQAPVPHPGVTSRSNTYVRCVYDEWYWGSDKLNDITTFTWGDAER
ncbi:MAG: hypothetical protein IKZ60_04805 [Bacteroidales bacterium]|nr:hypothetical protein [Bacteroidales bacterium]